MENNHGKNLKKKELNELYGLLLTENCILKILAFYIDLLKLLKLLCVVCDTDDS